MNIQYISDYKGNTTGVFIPIQEWEGLKSKFKGLEEVELAEQSKNNILENIKNGLEELKLIEKGELRTRPAKEFINEL